MTNTYKNIASLLFIIFFFCNNTYSNSSAQNLEKLKKFETVVITSDSFVLDYQKGYAVYSKNVDLSQVNKKLHADNLCFYFDKKNLLISNKANISGSPNTQLRLVTAFNNSRTPVTYTETHVNRPIKAMADMIKFDPISNKVIFEKNALIEQNNKTLSSELVYYDLKKEIVYMPKVNKQRSKLLLGAL